MRPTDRGWLYCEVWQRPDLSRAEGAQLAEAIAAHIQRLAPMYAGFLFDLRRATPMWGPATDLAIGQMLAPWEALGKPAYVVSKEAIQQIAMRRLIADQAPASGRLFDDLDVAQAQIEHQSQSQSRGPASQPPRSHGPASQPPRGHGPASQPPRGHGPASQPPRSHGPASQPPRSLRPAGQDLGEVPASQRGPLSQPPRSRRPAGHDLGDGPASHGPSSRRR